MQNVAMLLIYSIIQRTEFIRIDCLRGNELSFSLLNSSCLVRYQGTLSTFAPYNVFTCRAKYCDSSFANGCRAAIIINAVRYKAGPMYEIYPMKIPNRYVKHVLPWQLSQRLMSAVMALARDGLKVGRLAVRTCHCRKRNGGSDSCS